MPQPTVGTTTSRHPAIFGCAEVGAGSAKRNMGGDGIAQFDDPSCVVPTLPHLFRYRLGSHLSRFRSEEHTSELQSLMRISYAVFCLKKNNHNNHRSRHHLTD